jgi:hypothetical protein
MKICRLCLYLILVILVGGAGCWISLGQFVHDPTKYEYKNFISNLGTFSISIAVLAYADRILSKRNINTTVALFIFFLMVVAAAISVVCIVFHFPYSTIAAIISLLGALACWTMVNWNSPEFTDKADPFSTLGGPTNTTSA